MMEIINTLKETLKMSVVTNDFRLNKTVNTKKFLGFDKKSFIDNLLSITPNWIYMNNKIYFSQTDVKIILKEK